MAQEPIRPDLWELVKSALAPTRQAGRNYINSGRYVPNLDLPKYKENDQGWPQVVSERTILSDDGPPDWTMLFSRDAGTGSYVLIDSVPELAEGTQRIVEMCKADPVLGLGLSFLWEVMGDDPDRRDKYVQYDFLGIVENILGRAEAVGIEDEDGLTDLYLQVERGRFSDTLAGDVVVPLVLTAFAFDESVNLMDNIWLERLDEPMQRARAMDWRFHDEVSPWVAAAATHAVVMRDVTFKNTAWPPRLRKGEEQSPVPLDDVDRFVESLQIVTGKDSGYAQVLVRPRDWVVNGWRHDLPPVWEALTLRAYPEEMNNGGWRRQRDHVSAEEVSKVAVMMPRLKQSPKNVLLAARALPAKLVPNRHRRRNHRRHHRHRGFAWQGSR